MGGSPPAASADGAPTKLFWSDAAAGTIGSANTDGTNVDDTFADTGAYQPDAVTSDGTHLFWLDGAAGTIGRANVDGTNVQRRFIELSPDSRRRSYYSLTNDGTHLYWSVASRHSIGRANLDGTDVDNDFVTESDGGTYWPTSLAVTANHLYWAESDGDASISRISLATREVDANLVTTPSNIGGIAIQGDHLYWTSATAVGRANLDGSSPEPAFITGADQNPGEIRATPTHLYWQNGRTVARANLDGTSVQQQFAATGSSPRGPLALDAGHLYWTDYVTGLGRMAIDGSDVTPHFLGVLQQTGGLAAASSTTYWGTSQAYGAIGRLNADGSNLTPNLITPTPLAGAVPEIAEDIHQDIATDGKHVFWWSFYGINRANLDGTGATRWVVGTDGGGEAPTLAATDRFLFWGGADGDNREIGRANIDGTDVRNSLLTAGHRIEALAANDHYVFWTEKGVDAIHRANLDGTGTRDDLVTGIHPTQLTADAAHVYWTDEAAGRIGRATTDGATVQDSFITGLRDPSAITVATEPIPLDTTPPTISITTPAQGQVFTAGQAVASIYACNDETDGSAVAHCSGPATVDTTTPGTKTFTVTATDAAGNTSTTSTTYSVQALPSDTSPPPTTTSATPPPSNPPPSNPLPGTKPPVKVVPVASAKLAAKSVKHGKKLTLKLKNVPNKAKLAISWKPRRGKTIRGTVRAKPNAARFTAPKKKGAYRLTVRYGSKTLLNNKKVTVR
ncbi:hypothetical protein AB0L40_00595 [Patulibacter sp. NPDC049589]|uniref:hypothetical protein n=1 Tax=Patulibacter sp. NPDC049589 TaxID=3154731 RepID=UPI00342A4D57